MKSCPLTPLPSSLNFLLHRLAVTEKGLSWLVLFAPREGKSMSFFQGGKCCPNFIYHGLMKSRPLMSLPPPSLHIPLHTEKELPRVQCQVIKESFGEKGRKLMTSLPAGGRGFIKGEIVEILGTSVPCQLMRLYTQTETGSLRLSLSLHLLRQPHRARNKPPTWKSWRLRPLKNPQLLQHCLASRPFGIAPTSTKVSSKEGKDGSAHGAGASSIPCMRRVRCITSCR